MINEEKAALILLSLGDEIAAGVMKNLERDQQTRIEKCMSSLKGASREDMEYAAMEFKVFIGGNGKGTEGRGLAGNTSPDSIGNPGDGEFARAVDSGSSSLSGPIIEKLRNAHPRVVADFIKTEHPQTVALILSYLRPDQVADILESLPPDRQHNVAKRIATLGSVPREFLEEMTKTLESEMVGGTDSEEHAGGIQVIADILNMMSRGSGEKILELLDGTDPELAGEIKDLMFTFDDIFKLDDRSMRVLLEEVEREDLPRALKIVDDETREKVFGNMSKRAAEMLKEDISVMPPIRLSEAESSQRAIIEVAKRLETEGKITLSGSGEKDEFV